MSYRKYNGRFDESISLLGTFRGEHHKPSFVLCATPALLVTWRYFGSKDFYLQTLSGWLSLGKDDFSAEVYFTLAAAVLFVLIPLLLIKFVLRENAAAYGWQKGDWRYGGYAFLLLAPIFVLSGGWSAFDPEFGQQYPMFGAEGGWQAVTRHLTLYLVFYGCWEFFFRGFLLFGLRGTMTDWNAVLIQTTISALLHIGKPTAEIYGSIIGGIIWGILAIRTKSLWGIIVLHWLLGATVDVVLVLLR
jgi:membrane protease YdiL (CAAX protease family)